MGAGKSTVGVRLARELEWSFVDLDEEIVRAEGGSIAEIFQMQGEAQFRAIEHRALAVALDREEMVLALGGGAIETAANRKLLSEHPETWLVYLEAPLDVLIARCRRQQSTQPETARRPVLERSSELADRFLVREPLYQAAHCTIPTAELDIDETVRMILSRSKEHCAGLRQ